MSKSLIFPIGHELVAWNLPAGCELIGPPLAPLWPRERISALSSAVEESLGALKSLVADKRRAVIVVGDFSLPAPYPILLPKLTKALVAAGIRPSRITFLCAPGQFDKVLGASAIRRYGEELVGEYDLRPWDGNPVDPAYAQADVRLALFPSLPTAEARLLREIMRPAPDWSLPSLFPENAPPDFHDFNADVYWVSGGGHPIDAVFEEALLGVELFLRRNPCTKPHASKTLVFCFSGKNGVGSAAFFQDVFSLLSELDEYLASGEETQGNLNDANIFDPATALAKALSSFSVIIHAPDMLKRDDGRELAEYLSELPQVQRRLQLVENESAIWSAIHKQHGQNVSVQTVPFVEDTKIQLS